MYNNISGPLCEYPMMRIFFSFRLRETLSRKSYFNNIITGVWFETVVESNSYYSNSLNYNRRVTKTFHSTSRDIGIHFRINLFKFFWASRGVDDILIARNVVIVCRWFWAFRENLTRCAKSFHKQTRTLFSP